MSERMRAVRIVSHEGEGELEVSEVEKPSARADRVRVRVRAAGLNRADLLQKRGRYPAPPGAPADIPGLEFAGEVEQVGEDARAWRAGARVFGGTAGRSEKIERAREFGLDEGVVVGDDPHVFAEAVRGWTRGAGVNVVLDLVGAPYLDANLDALSARGRMLLVGTLGGASAALDFRKMMSKRLSVTGTHLRARSAEEKASAVRRFAAHVVPLLARRHVRPVLDAAFTLEDVRAAYARLESNETFGKVVLLVNREL